MKIEAGKSYVTRGGEVLTKATLQFNGGWALLDAAGLIANRRANGSYWSGHTPSEYDIVAEFIDDKPDGPVSAAAASIAVETFGDLKDYTDATGPLLTVRGSTHGDWREQAERSQSIKAAIGYDLIERLRPDEREALEMIAVKLSRIVTGDPHFEDHWRDIAGYATLAANQNAKTKSA